MMVRRFLCGPIACWILAQISSLVTWSLYEHIISMAHILCCEGPWFTSVHKDGCDMGVHQSCLGTEINVCVDTLLVNLWCLHFPLWICSRAESVRACCGPVWLLLDCGIYNIQSCGQNCETVVFIIFHSCALLPIRVAFIFFFCTVQVGWRCSDPTSAS